MKSKICHINVKKDWTVEHQTLQNKYSSLNPRSRFLCFNYKRGKTRKNRKESRVCVCARQVQNKGCVETPARTTPNGTLADVTFWEVSGDSVNLVPSFLFSGTYYESGAEAVVFLCSCDEDAKVEKWEEEPAKKSVNWGRGKKVMVTGRWVC